MEALGAYLKKNRDQRGVSLEEMAANTKINVSIISYLEEDRFDKLPAPVFVKGFIRSYLNYLGVNPKEAVLFYELISGGKPKKDQILSPVSVEKEDDQKQAEKVYNIRLSQRGLIIVISIATLMILTLMYLIIFPSSDTSSSDEISEYRKRMLLRMAPTTVTTPPAIVQEEQKVVDEKSVEQKPVEQKVIEPKPVEQKVVEQKLVEQKPAEPAQKIIIKAKKDLWVKVQIDNGKTFDFLLRSGNTRKIEAQKELKILIGDASGADIEYQGQLIKDLGQAGHTKSLVFPGLGKWKDALVP
jgi:cytoskeleton protein RodZ